MTGTGFAFGKKSLGYTDRVALSLMTVATKALVNFSRVDFGITEEQTRTLEYQKKLVARGVSKTLKSEHVLYRSGQEYSRALDLVPWVNGKFDWGDNQWRHKLPSGEVVYGFHEIAAAMRKAAIFHGVTLTWGAVWDTPLNDLPDTVIGLRKAVEDYKARRKKIAPKKAVFIDGPHFELLAK